MIAISNERIDFNHQREQMGAWCLCPAWMGWMPWLVDGVEVLQMPKKTMESNRTSGHYQASLKGI